MSNPRISEDTLLKTITNTAFKPVDFRAFFYQHRDIYKQSQDYLLSITNTDILKSIEITDKDNLEWIEKKRLKEIKRRYELAINIFKIQKQDNKNNNIDEITKGKTEDTFLEFINNARNLKDLPEDFYLDLDYFEALVLDGKKNENLPAINHDSKECFLGFESVADFPKNFEAMAERLNAKDDKLSADNKFQLGIIVEKNVEKPNFKPFHIRSYSIIDKQVYTNQSNNCQNYTYATVTNDRSHDDNKDNASKQIDNPNSNYKILQGDENKKAEEKIKEIENILSAKIKKLNSSMFYSDAAKAKADEFGDLLKLIHSRRDNFHVTNLIHQWQQRESRHWLKITFNEKNQKIKRFTTVDTLMRQERGIFTFFGSSGNTDSIKLIEAIKELAKQADQLNPEKTAKITIPRRASGF